MTTKAAILSAIRQKCLDCCCGQPSEVRECPVTECDLWPFRFGRDPDPSPRRGFAKPDGYTDDSSSRAAGRHPDSGEEPRSEKSHGYTDDSTVPATGRHRDSGPTRRAGKSSVYTCGFEEEGAVR